VVGRRFWGTGRAKDIFFFFKHHHGGWGNVDFPNHKCCGGGGGGFWVFFVCLGGVGWWPGDPPKEGVMYWSCLLLWGLFCWGVVDPKQEGQGGVKVFFGAT